MILKCWMLSNKIAALSHGLFKKKSFCMGSLEIHKEKNIQTVSIQLLVHSTQLDPSLCYTQLRIHSYTQCQIFCTMHTQMLGGLALYVILCYMQIGIYDVFLWIHPLSFLYPEMKATDKNEVLKLNSAPLNFISGNMTKLGESKGKHCTRSKLRAYSPLQGQKGPA